MKTQWFTRVLSFTLLIAACFVPKPVSADPAVPREAELAYEDMKQAFGLVPSFFKAFPPEAVGAAWEEFKGFQLNPKTALPNKYKELIGLAVAAQVPCSYCTYFHTKAGELGGATSRELTEAVVMASITRQWSTVLNGQQTDEAAFRQGFSKIQAYVKEPHRQANIVVTDADSAYRDIEQTLGVVLPMFRLFPKTGIAGAWKEFKTVQLNPKSAIPNKYKELIGLAVGSQIPCRYCVYFHTEAAKMNGATDVEIQEAITMAAITRHWSTFLNGMMIDEDRFRRETDQAIQHVRRKTQVAAR